MMNTSRYQSVDWPAKPGEPCGRIPRGVFRSDQVSSLLTSRTSSKDKPTNYVEVSGGWTFFEFASLFYERVWL